MSSLLLFRSLPIIALFVGFSALAVGQEVDPQSD